MRIFLWVAQIVLAVFSFAGGLYKLFAWEQLAMMPASASLARPAWAAAGIFEVICALLLLSPIVLKGRQAFARAGAIALLLESIALAVLYGTHSTRFEASNPLPWVLLMAVLAAIVAFARRPR